MGYQSTKKTKGIMGPNWHWGNYGFKGEMIVLMRFVLSLFWDVHRGSG